MALAPNPLNAYPNTGLAQLGDTLLRASSDYANIRLRDQQEAQRRAQQLSDLQDARNFALTREGVQRTQHLEDIETGRKNRLTDTGQLATLNARFDSLQRAEKLGLIAAQDIGKIAIEEEALRKLQKRDADEYERARQQRERAQKRVDANAIKEEKLLLKIYQDEQIASSRPEVDPVKLRNYQERLARAANPKSKEVSEAQIEAQFEAAMAKYEAEELKDWAIRTQEAKANAANNKLILQSLLQENRQLGDKHGVVGDVPEKVLADSALGGAAQRTAPTDPMAAFKAELEKRRPKAQPQATPSPVVSLANPMNDPALAAYQAEQQAGVLTPRQQRTTELARLLGQRDEARAARGNLSPALQAPSLAGLTDPSMFPVPVSPAPSSPAQRTSLAGALSAAGVDEAKAMEAYRTLLMQTPPGTVSPPSGPQRTLAPPLPQLPWQPSKTPASVFQNTYGFFGV